MDLEKIKEACAINYNFTIKNWSTTEPLRDPVEDVKLLIAEVERQAEEIGKLEVDRDLAEYDKEKAEAELARVKEEGMKWSGIAGRKEAENQRLTERVRELCGALEKQTAFAIAWIDAAYVARKQIFGPNDKVDYEAAKIEARNNLSQSSKK